MIEAIHEAHVVAKPMFSGDPAAVSPATRRVPAERRLRIAHVQLLPLLSGVQRVSLEEFAQLDPEVYDRTLICREPGPLSEAMEKIGVRCLYCPRLVRAASPRRDLRALLSLVATMRRERFDVVHTHSSKTGVLGRVAARIAGVPTIVHTVHGFAFAGTKSPLRRRLFEALERISGRCSDVVVCLNDSDRRIAKESLAIPEERLHLVPNGVDLARFPFYSVSERMRIRREELGLPVSEPAVVMVGRLWDQKDPMTLAEAAISLLKDGVRAHFVFLGDGQLRQPLEELIAAHGVGDRIHILGWRDDVARLLPAFDLFALPSRWEGMPLAILEAMASGLPCVVSDIPGNSDLVDDGINGLLVPCGDVEMFAACLGKLLLDEQSRTAMGRAGRVKVERDHDLGQRTLRIEEIYRNVLDRKASRLGRAVHHIEADQQRLQRIPYRPR